MINKHQCKYCPHDVTVVRVWENDTWRIVPIVDLSDDDLLREYAAEVDGATRWISSDPPSNEDELREEILRRMKR